MIASILFFCTKTEEQEEHKAREAQLESCMRVIQSKGQLHQQTVTRVMNGLPRAGKTTTKERLIGHILQVLKKASPSTGVAEPPLKVTITELPRSAAMVSGSQWTLLSLDDESLHLVNNILQAAGGLQSKSHLASVTTSHITRILRSTPTVPISLLSSSAANKKLPSFQSTSPQQATSKDTTALCVHSR